MLGQSSTQPCSLYTTTWPEYSDYQHFHFHYITWFGVYRPPVTMTLSGISMAQAYLKKYLEFGQTFSPQSFHHVSYFKGKWTVDSSLVSDKSSVVILLAASLPDIVNNNCMIDVEMLIESTICCQHRRTSHQHKTRWRWPGTVAVPRLLEAVWWHPSSYIIITVIIIIIVIINTVIIIGEVDAGGGGAEAPAHLHSRLRV